MASISANVYIDKLDDVVNKYNKTHILTLVKKLIIKKKQI